MEKNDIEKEFEKKIKTIPVEMKPVSFNYLKNMNPQKEEGRQSMKYVSSTFYQTKKHSLNSFYKPISKYF